MNTLVPRVPETRPSLLPRGLAGYAGWAGTSLLCSRSWCTAWCTVPWPSHIPTSTLATPQPSALLSLSLSGANFQIEVLPQGKAWQDVPGVQGDPRSCIVVPSGLATPLLVLEGDDPPQPQPICAFLFSIPVRRQLLPDFARRTDSHL